MPTRAILPLIFQNQTHITFAHFLGGLFVLLLMVLHRKQNLECPANLVQFTSPFPPIVDPAAQLSLKLQRLHPFFLDLVSAGIGRTCDVIKLTTKAIGGGFDL